ncbi:hypothetical protein CONPUDRAFT_167080 [Coniophora puteana RWD-64-598 SS2]|uniref:Uncharacterized protein n=1 Tax=Coniophora puteana (strain RWD-64-598) TaxID=741705 RepID=A0A5M3MJW9_CONPW|nr:uncharacterized protein CONPUDRAFT_167080 [Coniophora puteana RWD-64-598 SS2]EIW79307.1 hypothetical protein CONPUDRAFT_167080 [Coniophora puteana RWD-64-598 SS2]
MLDTISGYSPLFTLGLLSETHPEPPATSPTECPPPQLTRVSQDAQSHEGGSAFFFTLHPVRDSVESRSFLSLDLADSSLSTGRHCRMASNVSKSTSWTCTTDMTSFNDIRLVASLVSELSFEQCHSSNDSPILPRMTYMSRRRSHESMRSIPSPKPAPSSQPPKAPSLSGDTATQLLPITLPSRQSLSVQARPSQGEASASRTDTLLSPVRLCSKALSTRSTSISSADRRKSRSAALACLEGRGKNRTRSSLGRDFMSFSDDEDDDPVVSQVSSSALAPVSENAQSLVVPEIEDEEDVVSPIITRPASSKPSTLSTGSSQGQRRKRRSTLDSWIPFKSFIDFKDDELGSWNWRSFIEINGAA